MLEDEFQRFAELVLNADRLVDDAASAASTLDEELERAKEEFRCAVILVARAASWVSRLEEDTAK